MEAATLMQKGLDAVKRESRANGLKAFEAALEVDPGFELAQYWIAITAGDLGDIEPGFPKEFAIAIAIADDAAGLSDMLDRARIAWETEQVGLTPENLSTALLRFSENPFSRDTVIGFSMAATGPARVEVFDLRGRRVRTLLDEVRRTGIHFVGWDGRDRRGASVASGIYFVRLETASGTSTERLTRVR